MGWGSIFFDGNSALGDFGDVGPVPGETFAQIMQGILCLDTTLEGVFRPNNVFSAFNLIGGSSPLTLLSGVGVVNGKLVYSTANTPIVVPTPASQSRNDRLVLRDKAADQRIRHAVLTGVEGAGGYPAFTTNPYQWEVPLWKWTIDTGGAITLTDERVWPQPRIQVTNAMVEDRTFTSEKMAVIGSPIYVLVPPSGVYNNTDDVDVPRGGEATGFLIQDNKSVTALGACICPTNVVDTVHVAALVYCPSDSGNVYGQMAWAGMNLLQAYATKSAQTPLEVTAITAAQHTAVNWLLIPDADITFGQIWSFNWNRLATSGSDTLDANLYLLGFLLRFNGIA